MSKKLLVVITSLLLLVSFASSIFAKDKEDRGALSKITFIHYKKNFAKPGGGGKGTICYGNFGKGVVWKSLPQSVVINPTNSLGLSANFIKGVITSSLDTWDGVTSTQLYSSVSFDDQITFDGDLPDGKNALGFDNYPAGNVIAVTTVWGYFGGPVLSRGIVEFDIMFDTDFAWGDADKDGTVMDLQNIATHEIGHGWGMADIYNSSCDQVTMYGYSTEGETIKRTLEQPDIKGIQSLYN